MGSPFTAPTFGERQIKHLLRGLPRKQFSYFHEPEIVVPDGLRYKPDFVIVSHSHGLVILEVKDWVNVVGGDHQFIHTIRKDGKPASYTNPIRTAEQYAYALKRCFEERQGLWESHHGHQALKFPWQVMVALPKISRHVISEFEQSGIWPAHVVIGMEDLLDSEQLQAALERLPWRFRIPQSMGRDELDYIRELLAPSLTITAQNGDSIGVFTAIQRQLVTEPLHSNDRYQLSLFGNEAQSLTTMPTIRLVRGVAGSGKTLILINRVKYLLKHYPQARILFIAFNTDLVRSLQQTLLHESSESLDIMTVHGLCKRILAEQWRQPLQAKTWLRNYEQDSLNQLGVNSDYVAAEFAWRKEIGLWTDEAYLNANRSGRGMRLDPAQREFINRLFNSYRAYQTQPDEYRHDWDDLPTLAQAHLHDEHFLLHCYDVILLDEGQDFAPSWVALVMQMLKPNGNLLICDDPCQSLSTTYTWQQKGVNVVGKTRLLRVPFRSTREINLAAHSLVAHDVLLAHDKAITQPDLETYDLAEGPLPCLVSCTDMQHEQQFIDHEISKLLARGVSSESLAILCHNKHHTEHWSQWQAQGVYVSHFGKMKGLEFQTVFVPHLHQFLPINPQDTNELSAKRRKLFVAMTRARFRLYLSFVGVTPALLTPILPYCSSQDGRLADF